MSDVGARFSPPCQFRVNLEARDFFSASDGPKNAEGMIRKVARSSRTAEWVGYSK